MDINFELYKVFYYVATTLSFSDAGKKLYISQSAVSQAVKTLESKLGQQLFSRSTKKVTLTPAGELLLRHITPAINLIRRGETQLTDANNLGQLHLCASDTICRYLLVPYLQQFHKRYPNIPIKVTNATSLHAVDLLEEGRVDLIVTNLPNSRLNPANIYRRILTFRDVFVANPAFFDLSEKELSLADLTRYPLLMLDGKSTTSEYLRELFLRNELDFVPDIELSSNDLLIDLACIGIGIACVPDYCVPKNSADLYQVILTDEIPHREVAVSFNQKLPLSGSARAFLELLPSVGEV